MSSFTPSADKIEILYKKLYSEASEGGYNLNPDVDFTKALVEGLLINQERYGYQACPCRLASEKYETDRDIVCPCIYRDPDLSEFGTCYCGLYVSDEVKKGEKKLKSIPDRHGADPVNSDSDQKKDIVSGKLEYPVWRCTVCGYICAREAPPEKCPICKVPKDRFRRFM